MIAGGLTIPTTDIVLDYCCGVHILYSAHEWSAPGMEMSTGELTTPADWSEEDTERLKELL